MTLLGALDSQACFREPVVFRTFLQQSNDLKRSWSVEAGMPVDLGTALRAHLFSKWVWITEISTARQFTSKSLRALGQVIQDSAGHAKIAGSDELLALYMPPDLVVLVGPDGSVRTPDIRPYASIPCFHRT